MKKDSDYLLNPRGASHHRLDNQLLAQVIAERKGCHVCGKKPTIYMVRLQRTPGRWPRNRWHHDR
jgi:hypothetical protein